ncbi:MAG: hypothetical protein KDK08_25775, partial [Rhizobiaceae bacterium]|nr:hypothetical protein [Rhizobiaceae bacterium]
HTDAAILAAPRLYGSIAEIKSHGLPPFRFAVLGMDVTADLDVADHLADVFAIFDHSVPSLQRLQRDLVSNRDVGLSGQAEIEIVGRNDAQHIGARSEVFDDDDADIILTIVDEKLWNTQKFLLFANGMESSGG